MRVSWGRFFVVGIAVVAVVAAVAAVAACGQDHTPASPPPSASISFASIPDTATVADNQLTVSISAVARDASGHVVPNAIIDWSSTDTTVLSVRSAGSDGEIMVVLPRAPLGIDSAYVVARWNDVVARHRVVVVPPIADVEIVAISSLRIVGSTDSLQMVVYSTTANGHPLVTGLPIAWTSSNPGVISTSPGGALVAHAPGTATLTGSVLGRSRSVTMVVIPPYRAMEIAGVGETPTVIGLNENGSVLGQEDAPTKRYFLARNGGTIQYLSGCTTAYNITNTESVLCATTMPDGTKRLAVWQSDSLHVLAGWSEAPVKAVMNDSGAVAFIADSATSVSLCASPKCLGVWQNGTISPLTAPYFPQSILRFDPDGRLAITVADTRTFDYTSRFSGGYVYDPAAGWEGITALSQYPGGIYFLAANRAGVMVGTAYTWNEPNSAIYYAPGGSVQTFATFGIVVSINDDTFVIGNWFGTPSGPFMIRLDGAVTASMQDLTDSTWVIDTPARINNARQIVALAHNRTDGHHGLILLAPAQ